MATFNSANGGYQSGNKTLFETQMLALSNGHIVDATNPLPVTLGSSNITITGDVNVGTTVTVQSSPEDPVDMHIRQVGTSGILDVPYLPISGNVVVSNAYVTTQNVSFSNQSIYLNNNVVVNNTVTIANGYQTTQNVQFSNQSVYLTTNVVVNNVVTVANGYQTTQNVQFSNQTIFINGGQANVNISHSNSAAINVNTPLDVRTNTESIYSAPWDMQVARGKVPEVVQVNVFGYAPAVNTQFHTIWENTPTDVVFPTVASQWNIVSSSASDNTAASVTIIGLDSNWDAQVETIYLNGVTPVTTVKSFLRVNIFIMNTPGAGQNTNVGDITIYTNGNTHAKIAAGFGKMQNAWYSVARASGLYVQNINIFAGEANQGNQAVWFTYRVVTKNNNTGVQLTILQTPFANEYKVQRFNPVKYPEKTDVQWQVKTNSGTHGVGVILEAVLIGDAAP